jgi:hypothetical protein
MFVGAERQQIVADLVESFESVADGGGSKFVCLASLPGTGKTRIVQEFFAALSARQEAPGYWPQSLIPADSGDVRGLMRGRKRVYPHTVDVPEGAKMPWMWWGLSCAVRDDGQYSPVMFADATQLSAHAGGIVEGKAFKGAAAAAGFDATSSVLGVLGLLGMAVAPPVGIAIAVTGAAKAAWDHRRIVQQAHQVATSTVGEVDAVNHGREKDLDQLVDSLATISRKVPTVIVVDDAHWADQGLITVIEGLLQDRSSRVLFLATTWPHVLETYALELGLLTEGKETLSPLATWWLQNSETPSVERIDLLPLTSSDLADVLQDDADWLTDDAVTALLEHIGNNPLTARVLLRTRKIQEILQRVSFSANDLQGVPRDLEDAFALYWAEIPDAVKEMLVRAAQLGATYVPAPVIAAATAQGIEDAEASLIKGANPYALANALEENLYSFIEPVMHQIARRSGQNELLTHGEITGIRQALVDTVFSADFSHLTGRAQETLWTQHVALAEQGLCDLELAASSAWALAFLSYDQYGYKTAIRFAELSLDWADNPDDPDTLTIRNYLASWYREVGDVNTAISLLEPLLDDQRRILGEEHRSTLVTRRELATGCGEVGDLNKAVSLLEALLNDQTRILGNDHPNTLTTRNELARLVGEAGDVNRAVTLFEELLADRKRILGEDEVNTLTTRNNLARLVGEAGDVNRAVTLLEALLDDRKRILGNDHPDTMTTRSNLARLVGEAGDVNREATLLEALLDDRKRILGNDHPKTLITRNNLARLYGTTGDLARAISLSEALLEDRIRILGPDHPDTLNIRNNLASWSGRSGNPTRAITLLEALLDNQSRILGPDHPKTLLSRHNLAFWSSKAGDLTRAISLFEALVKDRIRILGPDHPNTLVTRYELASRIAEAGDINRAILLIETLLDDRIRIFGQDDPVTLNTCDNLAYFYERVGDVDRAISLLGVLLNTQTRILGPDHPSTVATRHNLDALYA